MLYFFILYFNQMQNADVFPSLLLGKRTLSQLSLNTCMEEEPLKKLKESCHPEDIDSPLTIISDYQNQRKKCPQLDHPKKIKKGVVFSFPKSCFQKVQQLSTMELKDSEGNKERNILWRGKDGSLVLSRYFKEGNFLEQSILLNEKLDFEFTKITALEPSRCYIICNEKTGSLFFLSYQGKILGKLRGMEINEFSKIKIEGRWLVLLDELLNRITLVEFCPQDPKKTRQYQAKLDFKVTNFDIEPTSGLIYLTNNKNEIHVLLHIVLKQPTQSPKVQQDASIPHKQSQCRLVRQLMRPS